MLHILGCAGWIPGVNETSCFLVEYKDHLIMLDAGTGVSRLKDYQNLLNCYDEIHIILSHYHLDHMIGFIYLVPYLKDKTIHIYGPGQPVYPKSTYDYFADLLQPAFFSRTVDRLSHQVICHDYAGKDFLIDDITITIRPQQHSSPSFLIGIEDDVIYATDTCFDEKIWDYELKARVLLHECWEVHATKEARHSALDRLLKGLPNKQFDQILIIHHNPKWTDDDIKEISQMISGTNFILAKDGMKL